MPRNNSCRKDEESIEREDQSACSEKTVIRTLDMKSCDQATDSATNAEFLVHDTSLLPKRNLNVVNADNETVVIDLHKSEAERKDTSMVKYLQTRQYVNQHSKLNTKQQRNHYERLNRNGERSDNHYAKLVEDGNLPPNMQASVHLIS